MCGIAGFWSRKTSEVSSADREFALLKAMTDAIKNRGPDAEGHWLENKIGLGHRRLSIVDVSASGAQPMLSANGRWRIVFNGEIYNHLRLRDELKGEYSFKGTSDTETLLAAIDAWGLKIALQKSAGMFAFALWDQEKKELTLARDRLGIKPLYFSQSDEGLFFSSELSSFFAMRSFGFEFESNRKAVKELLEYSYVRGTHSLLEDVHKLAPGHFLKISQSTKTLEAYWELPVGENQERNFGDSLSEFESVFAHAAKEHLMSDVPLGLFLSGGIDSSFICTLLQKNMGVALNTFSVGFSESSHNEAPEARKLAKYLGTSHHEIDIREKDILDLVGEIPNAFSEAFADISQLPSLLLSKFASQSVKVALAGDGGDELFWGYSRYAQLIKLNKILKLLPSFAKSALHTETVIKIASNLLNRYPEEIESALKTNSFLDLHKWSLKQTRVLDRWWKNDREDAPTMNLQSLQTGQGNYENLLLWLEQQTYLVDDLLVKTDRATMHYSIEGRVPFLDHRVVEAAAKVPFEYKFKNRETKFLLKEILRKHLPPEFIDRPKRGFGAPTASWLRQALKPWACELITSDEEIWDELLDKKFVLQTWNEFQEGKHCRLATFFWNLLVFIQWKSHWKVSIGSKKARHENEESVQEKIKALGSF